MIALPAWLFSAGASLGKFYIKGETLNQTLSKKSLLFLVPSWSDNERLTSRFFCSLFIHFFSYSVPSCAAYLCLLPHQSKGMWFRNLSCCAWYSLPPPQWSINHRTVSWCMHVAGRGLWDVHPLGLSHSVVVSTHAQFKGSSLSLWAFPSLPVSSFYIVTCDFNFSVLHFFYLLCHGLC